jgi:hypothetical protein
VPTHLKPLGSDIAGVHSVATASKGNLYTIETYEGRRAQKLAYKRIGTVPAGTEQGVLKCCVRRIPMRFSRKGLGGRRAFF